MLIQRKTLEGIHHSPAMGAQLKRLHSLLGTPMAGPTIQARFFGDEAKEGGALSKSAFLDQLRAAIQSAADHELAAIQQSSADCPYLAKWFSHYQDKDAAYIQRAISLYAPDTAHAGSVEDYIQSVVERVRQGLKEHITAGSTEAVPEELIEENHAPEDFVHVANKETAQLSKLCSGGEREDTTEPETSVSLEDIYGRATIFNQDYQNVRSFVDADQTPKIIKQCSSEEIGYFEMMSGTPHFPICYRSDGTYVIIQFIGDFPNPAPPAYGGEVASNLQQAADICREMAEKGISHNDLDNNLLFYKGDLIVIDFGASRTESKVTALEANRILMERLLNEEQRISFRKLN